LRVRRPAAQGTSRRPRLPARPRKALGQHFLQDIGVLDRIVRESGVASGDTVIEVGPGTGELTERLVQAAHRVVAIELDETLAAHVRQRLAAPNLRVVAADVLDLTPAEMLAAADAAAPYSVIANIPYYITAPILRLFLEAEEKPERLTLLVQKEVAQSIAAGPGKMSLLGVSVQFYGEPRLLFTVPREAFSPPPEVTSAVIRIDVRDRPAIDVPDVEQFFTVVRAGFSQPRKQLHNALAGRLWLPPDSASDLLRSVGVDPMRRAQSLSLKEWARVAAAVATVQTGARAATTAARHDDAADQP
jgi:16S rRNA (adenine1518-N6/adenine1519-N6)-dimethyltransferase